MIKFDLNIYKEYQQYFILFDVIIKGVSSNKEYFLESIYLSPSSYRRAKNEGNKIGKQLAKELCEHFKYNLFTVELIDEIEERINNIYFNIYYKKFDTYDDDFNWINQLIDKRYIIYPILKLVKLIMILNNPTSPTSIINDYQELYEEVKSYENFYNDELKELLEIVEVSFQKDVDDYFLAKRYKNELTYYTISTKCMLLKRYIESIHFCHIAKLAFIKEENYKRVYFANLTLISNFNNLFKFEEAYELAQRQMLSLESLKDYDFEYGATRRHYVISCLGLKKYKEVIDYYNTQSQLNLSEVCCVLIARYGLDKQKYKDYLQSLLNTETNVEVISLYTLLDRYLKNKEKRLLQQIETYKIKRIITEILKKM